VQFGTSNLLGQPPPPQKKKVTTQKKKVQEQKSSDGGPKQPTGQSIKIVFFFPG
jgi:hypothetical protein